MAGATCQAGRGPLAVTTSTISQAGTRIPVVLWTIGCCCHAVAARSPASCQLSSPRWATWAPRRPGRRRLRSRGAASQTHRRRRDGCCVAMTSSGPATLPCARARAHQASAGTWAIVRRRIGAGPACRCQWSAAATACRVGGVTWTDAGLRATVARSSLSTTARPGVTTTDHSRTTVARRWGCHRRRHRREAAGSAAAETPAQCASRATTRVLACSGCLRHHHPTNAAADWIPPPTPPDAAPSVPLAAFRVHPP